MSMAISFSTMNCSDHEHDHDHLSSSLSSPPKAVARDSVDNNVDDGEEGGPPTAKSTLVDDTAMRATDSKSLLMNQPGFDKPSSTLPSKIQQHSELELEPKPKPNVSSFPPIDSPTVAKTAHSYPASSSKANASMLTTATLRKTSSSSSSRKPYLESHSNNPKAIDTSRASNIIPPRLHQHQPHQQQNNTSQATYISTSSSTSTSTSISHSANHSPHQDMIAYSPLHSPSSTSSSSSSCSSTPASFPNRNVKQWKQQQRQFQTPQQQQQQQQKMPPSHKSIGKPIDQHPSNPPLSTKPPIKNPQQTVTRHPSNGPKLLPRNFFACSTTDIIILVSSMLQELVLLNDALPFDAQNLTRFHSRSQPPISMLDYLIRITKFCSLEKSTILAIIYYIDLLCTTYKTFNINSLTVHRFLITAAMVASKGLCDTFCTNTHYAKVGGLSRVELNSLEVEFLIRVDYRIVPQSDRLQQYFERMVQRMSHKYQFEDSVKPQPLQLPVSSSQSCPTDNRVKSSTPSINHQSISSIATNNNNVSDVAVQSSGTSGALSTTGSSNVERQHEDNKQGNQNTQSLESHDGKPGKQANLNLSKLKRAAVISEDEAEKMSLSKDVSYATRHTRSPSKIRSFPPAPDEELNKNFTLAKESQSESQSQSQSQNGSSSSLIKPALNFTKRPSISQPISTTPTINSLNKLNLSTKSASPLTPHQAPTPSETPYSNPLANEDDEFDDLEGDDIMDEEDEEISDDEDDF